MLTLEEFKEKLKIDIINLPTLEQTICSQTVGLRPENLKELISSTGVVGLEKTKCLKLSYHVLDPDYSPETEANFYEQLSSHLKKNGKTIAHTKAYLKEYKGKNYVSTHGLFQLTPKVYLINIDYCGASSESINAILIDVQDIEVDTLGRIKCNIMEHIYEAFVLISDVYNSSRKVSKNKNKLFFEGDTATKLEREIDTFLKSKSFYDEHNIPHKFGVLLHGPPGNGKSSLIKELSGKFGFDPVDFLKLVRQDGSIRLSDSEVEYMDVEDIRDMMCPELKKVKFYFIEDIDKQIVNPKGGEDGDAGKVTLSTFLQALSGVESIDNAIIIATTNFINNLSDAIIKRPGRFDLIMEIGLPGEEEKKKLIEHFKIKFKNKEDLNLVLKKLENCSMAFVENFCLSMLKEKKKKIYTYNDCKEVLEKIEKHLLLLEEMEHNSVGFGRD